MQMHRSRCRWPVHLLLAALVAAGLGVSGCSDHGSVTGPEPAPETLAPQSVTGIVDNVFGGGEAEPAAWHPVAKVLVSPNTRTVVRGSRYTLTFPAGAVTRPTVVTIHEHNPLEVDVQLGPHGIPFRKPVTLTIDYRGSTADLLSRHWNGTLPLLYWLDDRAGLWVLLRGVNNVLTRQYTIELQHFSRYSFRKQDSTAGWN